MNSSRLDLAAKASDIVRVWLIKFFLFAAPFEKLFWTGVAVLTGMKKHQRRWATIVCLGKKRPQSFTTKGAFS